MIPFIALEVLSYDTLLYVHCGSNNPTILVLLIIIIIGTYRVTTTARTMSHFTAECRRVCRADRTEVHLQAFELLRERNTCCCYCCLAVHVQCWCFSAAASTASFLELSEAQVFHAIQSVSCCGGVVRAVGCADVWSSQLLQRSCYERCVNDTASK